MTDGVVKDELWQEPDDNQNEPELPEDTNHA